MSGVAAAKTQEHKNAGRMNSRSQQSRQSTMIGEYADILALQQSVGNQAVHGLLDGGIPPVVQSVINSGGQQLDPALRVQMESRFGQDFSQVRIHTDGRASGSAEAVSAKAYTVGCNVVFGQGRYAPDTSEGKRLLAHELAHVVQQRRGGAVPGPAHETDAGQAAEVVANGSGPVAVQGASGVGVARDEDDKLPWWKQQLNPLYQKALEKLPPQAARRLQELNQDAKVFVEGHGIRDAEIDAVVSAAQPLLNPVREALGLPKEKNTQPTADPSKTIWLGTPPLDVRLKKREDQRKRDVEAKQDNPLGLGAPEPRPGAAGVQDLPPGDLFAPEPIPTTFEQQLKSGQPFKHTFTPIKPEIDWSQVVWLGKARPSPPPPVPNIELTITGKDLMPIRDHKTGELKGYRYVRGDTTYEWDRDGNLTSSYGTERPLETPAVDPIDAALLVADVGPLIVKGVTAGGKALARKLGTEVEQGIGRSVLREGLDVASQEGSGIVTKKGPQRIGSEGIEDAIEAQAAKDIPPIKPKGGGQESTGAPTLDDEIDEVFSRLQGGGTGSGKIAGPKDPSSGLLVQTPVKYSGEAAEVADIGAGPKKVDLGLPPEKDLLMVTPTDKPGIARLGVRELDYTGKSPFPSDLEGKFTTMIINNPHGEVPNIEFLRRGLKPNGKIILQGNWNSNKFFRLGMKPGTVPPGGTLETVKAGIKVTTERDVPILGRGFSYTDPTRVGAPQPDSRITIEFLQDK